MRSIANRKVLHLILTLAALGTALALSSCAKNDESPKSSSCFSGPLNTVAGASGKAQIFLPDPVSRSGVLDLAPNSLKLDDYRSPVELSNLDGHGVLEGRFVDVRNGTGCSDGFGAYEPTQNFSYSHSDPRFQEAMAYYLGDRFRAALDNVSYLAPAHAVKIVAHCMEDDNAFYVRHKEVTGQVTEEVCLGDSVATPGASYGDDGIVTVHELQHATTVDLYSPDPGHNLNQFWYDEAGALNEAISDFMGLAFLAPTANPSIDSRVFSRWALGTFIPNHSGIRGSHKCPVYDPSYPNCAGYPSFSSASNTISYVYPDGVGWPYANNFDAPGYARSAYLNYRSQEEIHNAGIIVVGALWDVYEALKANHGGDAAAAQALSSKAVLEAIRHLLAPSDLNRSPVTFRGFAAGVVSAASLVGFSAADQASVVQALTARGLVGGPALASDWAAVGPGKLVTPGLRIIDNPSVLKTWLYKMGGDPNAITQGIATGLNNQLDPGDAVALWFDLRNVSDTTAGAVMLNVTSPDSEITFLDSRANVAPINAGLVQMLYGKINGNLIVQALTPGTSTYSVPVTNSYFGTNPYFDRNWNTAIWVKVSASAAHNKTVHFQVEATPSNGVTSTATFSALIN